MKNTEGQHARAVSALTFQSWVMCCICGRAGAEAGIKRFCVRYLEPCDAEVGPAGDTISGGWGIEYLVRGAGADQ